ncbi:MAG: MBL fold metallo-hydrolase, partial [bacterium]|nr:MBL fold metallo-hydrolase [bacterium]
MRDIIILLLTVFTLILTVQEGFTQETSLNNNIRITKLDNRIYKITFNPKHVINVVVLTGPEGVLFSDAAFEGTEKDLDEIIRNIGGGDIKYIINTHWHPDRTVLNNITGSNAGIISHLNSKIRSSEKQTIGEYKIDPLPDESLPAITFTEEMELFFNDEVVRMISLPGGHSDSDILVYFTKAKILYLGDLLFSES